MTKYGEPAVSFQNVSFRYGREPVILNATFEVPRGAVAGVVGQSGVGKTTMLDLAAGLLRPSQGSVEVNGESARSAVAKRRLSYVSQRPTLFPWLTAEENVSLALEVGVAREVDPVARRRRVSEALERAQIAHAREKRPAELSGGMRTRVALARAMVSQPDLLLLDEPFGGLDDVVREDLYASMQQLLSEHMITALLVTHSILDALILCDLVFVLAAPSGPRASSVVQSLSLEMPRPRTADAIGEPDFRSSWRRIHHALHSHADMQAMKRPA